MIERYDVRNRQAPAWRLFHEIWGIRIKRMHLITKEEIEMYGVPVNRSDNAPDYMEEIAQTYFTMVRLAEFYEDGAPFELNTPTDSVPMFDIINAHLENAVKAHQNPLSTVKPPYEDLVILDRFAGALHRLASAYTGTGNVFTGTLGFLNQFSRRGNVGSEVTKRITNSVLENVEYIPYQSPLRLLTNTVSPANTNPLLSRRQWE